jgi:hypothetical protein
MVITLQNLNSPAIDAYLMTHIHPATITIPCSSLAKAVKNAALHAEINATGYSHIKSFHTNGCIDLPRSSVNFEGWLQIILGLKSSTFRTMNGEFFHTKN